MKSYLFRIFNHNYDEYYYYIYSDSKENAFKAVAGQAFPFGIESIWSAEKIYKSKNNYIVFWKLKLLSRYKNEKN